MGRAITQVRIPGLPVAHLFIVSVCRLVVAALATHSVKAQGATGWLLGAT